MTRLPSLKGDEVVRALQRAGFTILRNKGSHFVMGHADGRRTVVPVHRGRDIRRGLLHKIVEDAKLTEDEFLALL